MRQALLRIHAAQAELARVVLTLIDSAETELQTTSGKFLQRACGEHERVESIRAMLVGDDDLREVQ